MSAKHELPEPVRSQVAAWMAERDLEVERQRADKMRDDSDTLYELRGWLRLCSDDPAGHAEFYHSACTYRYVSTLGPRYSLPLHFSELDDAEKHKRQCDKYLKGLPGHDTMRIEQLVCGEWVPV